MFHSLLDLFVLYEKLKSNLNTQMKKASLLETQVSELRNAEAMKAKSGKVFECPSLFCDWMYLWFEDNSEIQAKMKTLTFQLSRREAEIERLKKNIDDMALRHAKENSELVKSHNELQ